MLVKSHSPKQTHISLSAIYICMGSSVEYSLCETTVVLKDWIRSRQQTDSVKTPQCCLWLLGQVEPTPSLFVRLWCYVSLAGLACYQARIPSFFNFLTFNYFHCFLSLQMPARETARCFSDCEIRKYNIKRKN